jgi:hypothetical protein
LAMSSSSARRCGPDLRSSEPKRCKDEKDEGRMTLVLHAISLARLRT